MTRLDTRAEMARALAKVNQQLACISLDGPALEFGSEVELAAFRAGLERARREITAAELKVHDLTFGAWLTA